MRFHAYRSVPVPLDERGIDPEALAVAVEHGVRAVVCTPGSHNPTGTSIGPTRARELRDVLAPPAPGSAGSTPRDSTATSAGRRSSTKPTTTVQVIPAAAATGMTHPPRTPFSPIAPLRWPKAIRQQTPSRAGSAVVSHLTGTTGWSRRSSAKAETATPPARRRSPRRSDVLGSGYRRNPGWVTRREPGIALVTGPIQPASAATTGLPGAPRSGRPSPPRKRSPQVTLCEGEQQ